MKIDDMKPLGAFIENTIRPMFEEFRWIFEELDKRNISIKKQDVVEVITVIAKHHILTVIIETVRNLIIAGIVGYILWMKYRS